MKILRELAAKNAGQRRRDTAANLTQNEFYRLLKKREAANGPVRIFKHTDEGEQKKHIRRIEHKGPTEDEAVLVLGELGLPSSFLDELRGHTVAVAVQAAQEFWSSGSLSKPLLPVDATARRQPRISGFQRVFDTDLRPSYRVGDFAEFDNFVALSARGDPALFVLEGRKGVGKTFLVSQWLWSVMTAFPNALSIDCSDLSLDQIFPLAMPFFAADQRVPVSDGLGCLLVIDGLQAERHAGGVMVRLPNRLAHIDEVVEHVNRIFRGIGYLAVLLVIENNQQPFTKRELLQKLAPNAVHQLHRLRRLDDAAGAQFLLENGLDEVAEVDRRRLSARLHGLPIALVGAAQELQLLDRLDREKYLANLGQAGPRQRSRRRALSYAGPDVGESLRNFDGLFHSWLHRLGNGEVDQWRGSADPRRAHPHALLRLLAILSGPVTHGELEEIISRSQVSISRLTGRTIDYLRRGELPFVIYFDDKYDLHMSVRQALIEELQCCVETGDFDEFTDREQLEAIHWQFARMRKRTLEREAQADANCVTLVESFVHHMAEQIRLIPPEASNRRMVRAVRMYSSKDLNEFESGPGRLANGKLWWLAFHEARRFLVDSQRASTRVHGQFEAKARILARLIEVAADEGIKIELNNIDVVKEIAICWMHAGRLQLADKAITSEAPPTPRDLENRVGWLKACERVAVEVAVGLRRGIPTDELDAKLDPFLAIATGLALQAIESSDDATRMPERERGALRILSRAAEVAQAAAKDVGLVRFEQAVRLRACWYPRLFNGESARHFVVGLVRSSPKALPRARKLVEENIALYDNYNLEEPRKGSNDIVGFLVLDVALARFAAEYRRARTSLLHLEQHPFVRRREITFATRAELELETLRLDFVEGEDLDSLRSRATQLSARMRATDHMQLYFATEVLIGELLEGAELEEHCERLSEEFGRGNHRMRQLDISMLLRGESPTRILGL